MSETRREGRPGPLPNAASGRARIITVVIAVLWLGGVGAYLWGRFGPTLFEPQPFGLTLGVLALALIPVMLVAALVELAVQGGTLSQTNHLLHKLALQAGDAQATGEGRTALMTGAVRRELDKLSGALDSTLDRVAAIEAMVENQVGAIERAGGKAHQRAQAIRDLLQQERDRLETVAEELGASASAIAQSVSVEAGRVRQANEVAARELREAEGLLARQLQSFKVLAEEGGRAAHDRVAAIEAAAGKLESLVAVSLRGADLLTERLNGQHATLAASTRRLDEERTKLEVSLAQQDALLNRLEKDAFGLTDRLTGAVTASGAALTRAMGEVEARSSEAARTVRTEAESANSAGLSAAKAIADAAQAAREAAAGMRSAISVEVAAFNGELGTGVQNLDTMASTVGRALADTTQSAQLLLSSLEDTIGTMQTASDRLLGLFDQIGARTTLAENAIDNASVAVEQRLSQVPELAAEHAGRLSALLEDQARRMGALADSLTRRVQVSAPNIAPAAPKAEEPKAEEPQAPPSPLSFMTIPPRARESAQRETKEQEADEPVDMPAAFPRRAARREAAGDADRNNGAASSVGAAESAAIPRSFTREVEIHRPVETLGRLPWLGRKLRRNATLKPYAAATEELAAAEAAPPKPSPGTSNGFWSTLFARIEDDETQGTPMVPRGASVAPAAGAVTASIKSPTAYALEALYALAIDLDRLLEEDPPMDLWKRYRAGEADAFARRLIGLKSQGLEHRIRAKYRDDPEFRDHANRYRERFGAIATSTSAEGANLQETPAGRLFLLIDEALRPAAQ
jgi:uncharacterized protein YoxC